MAELAGAKLPQGVTIDGKPFTPMLYGKTSGDWLRDWIFVLLRRNWYDREMSWKLNQSGDLFDMKDAPFTETLVPANTQNSEALAARQRLQAVLNQLNPAAGKMDPGLGKGKGRKNRMDDDTENANAPSQ